MQHYILLSVVHFRCQLQPPEPFSSFRASHPPPQVDDDDDDKRKNMRNSSTFLVYNGEILQRDEKFAFLRLISFRSKKVHKKEKIHWYRRRDK